jgi:hypothetical protein
MIYSISNLCFKKKWRVASHRWRNIGKGERAQEGSYALRLLVKLGLGLSLRDVKNEGTSGDVHENKGEATKCIPMSSAFSQKTQDFGDNRGESCPLLQKNCIPPVEKSWNCLKNSDPMVRCFNRKSKLESRKSPMTDHKSTTVNDPVNRWPDGQMIRCSNRQSPIANHQ